MELLPRNVSFFVMHSGIKNKTSYLFCYSTHLH